MTEPISKRLVIELGTRAQQDLTELCQELEVNKTTMTNRAINLYRSLREVAGPDGVLEVRVPSEDPNVVTIHRWDLLL